MFPPNARNEIREYNESLNQNVALFWNIWVWNQFTSR